MGIVRTAAVAGWMQRQQHRALRSDGCAICVALQAGAASDCQLKASCGIQRERHCRPSSAVLLRRRDSQLNAIRSRCGDVRIVGMDSSHRHPRVQTGKCC